MSETHPPPFTFSPSLSSFNISPQSYLAANPTLTDLVVSATLFNTPFTNTPNKSHLNNQPPPRTLLIQRAATDRYPLCWECPGGGVELGGNHDSPSTPHPKVEADPTILHAVARELFEETGLKMTRVDALIDDTCEFTNKKGTIRARKFTFLVDFERGERGGAGEGEVVVGKEGEGEVEVVLNPEEHQDVMWATEEEVLRGVDEKGRGIVFAFGDQRERILEGFRLMREGV